MNGARRILFQAYGRRGLGHLRRGANVAEALLREDPAIELGFHTRGAPPEGFLQPGWRRFVDLPERPLDWQQAVDSFAPGLLVFDTIYRPTRPVAGPKARTALILRRSKPARHLETCLRLIETPVDRVLVPHDQTEFDLSFPPELQHLVRYLGPIVRVPTQDAIERVATRYGVQSTSNTRPFLLVSTPGGGGYPEDARAFLAAVAEAHRVLAASKTNLKHIVVLGPRFASDHLGFPWRAGDDSLRVVQQEPDLAALFHCADAVVSAGGYNTALEIRQAKVPAIFLPGSRTHDDPAQRVAGMAQAGLAEVLDGTTGPLAAGRQAGQTLSSPERLRRMRHSYRADRPRIGNRQAALALLELTD